MRLEPGETLSGFESRLNDPHIVEVGTKDHAVLVSVELVDGLTPETRERLGARLRGEPGVRSVRIDD